MQVKQYPFFIKSTVILFGIILLTYSLINLRDILVPIAFAVIISILLNPLVNRFKRSGISNVFSIIIAMLIALTVICGILYFLSSQMIGFGDNLPLLKSKLDSLCTTCNNGCTVDLV
jgi:predicted PurR-regulated permease PerM